MKYNKILAFGLSVFLLAGLMIPTLAVDSKQDFGTNYAVYLTGSDKNTAASLDMNGESYIYGNVLVQSGSFHLTNSWTFSIAQGKLYPAMGVSMDKTGLSSWEVSAILKQGIIAKESNFTATLPQLNSVTVPELEKKAVPKNMGGVVTISENGWYTNLQASSGRNSLIFDTSSGADLHIRADKLYVNGELKVNGTGRVFLYADDFVCEGFAQINAQASDSKQLVLFLGKEHYNYAIEHSSYVVATIAAPKSSLKISGFSQVVGNIWAGDNVTLEGSTQLKGFVYAPNANTKLIGDTCIKGSIVSKTLSLDGISSIEAGEYDDFDIDSPVEPPIPQDPPISDANYKPGILGEYYDASEFTNESAMRMKRVDSSIAFNFMTGSPDPCIEDETYAIRWTGYIKPQVTGNYRFKTYSDDGIRVTIAGKQLIDRWGLVSLDYTLAKETIKLEAGKYYPVTVEYQQQPIFAAVFLMWEAENVPMSIVPDSAFFIAKDTWETYNNPKFYHVIEKKGTGLNNTFYTMHQNGVDWIEKSSEIAPVNYTWGSGAPSGISDDSFMARMQGYIETRFTERTTLTFRVDDAIRVWINDQLVIDEWDLHSEEEISYSFDAVAGQKYKIRIDYADLELNATCVMSWSGELQEKQVVPAKFLYPMS